jgi:2-polyprenyl-6-methoxyphenol hydroxylase-like FAD-dependent oxidoreductase
VGARCAGAPLATLLARHGARVALVEQATFPRDTLSTHIIQSHALAFFDRLGVIEQLRATGAPFWGRLDVRFGDLRLPVTLPQQPGDVGGYTSIRRFVLDPILAQAAADAGADVQFATRVTDLVRENGRVAGVRVLRDGRERTLRASLVVGADGRNSTIATLAGARKYNLMPGERFLYWAFFEGVDLGPEPFQVFHQWDGRYVAGNPTDSGLYQVLVVPELPELPAFRQDLERSLLAYANSCEPVAKAIAPARRVGKIHGITRFEGFFREPSGPGWVLVGDAGSFKDPAPAQGIGNALVQVDALAPAIARALGGPPEQLDQAMARWGRWRDKDEAEHYWLSFDVGRAGPPPAFLVEILRQFHARGQLDSFLDLFNRRSRPSKVLSPARVMTATARLLARGDCDRRALVREVAAASAEDMRRRRLNRHPRYAADRTSDAGPTEVDDTTAVAAA